MQCLQLYLSMSITLKFWLLEATSEMTERDCLQDVKSLWAFKGFLGGREEMRSEAAKEEGRHTGIRIQAQIRVECFWHGHSQKAEFTFGR